MPTPVYKGPEAGLELLTGGLALACVFASFVESAGMAPAIKGIEGEILPDMINPVM